MLTLVAMITAILKVLKDFFKSFLNYSTTAQDGDIELDRRSADHDHNLLKIVDSILFV